MNDTELARLDEIRLEIIEMLKKKHGADKVQAVDDLGDTITLRMMNGEVIPGVEKWAYNIVNDFEAMFLSHPGLVFPALN